MNENTTDQQNKRATGSGEYFRALVTASSDFIFRVSPDWSVMYRMEGADVNAGNDPVYNWIEKFIHPLDREMVNEVVKNAISTKSLFQLEHRVLMPDRSAGWTFSTAVPILDDNGEIVEWFGAARDVTGRKNTEEALRTARGDVDQQKRLNEIVTSNTPDLVYVFSLDYRFTFANPALLAMWGKTWDEAIGKGLRENGYEEWHAAMHEREIDHVAATKEVVRGEVAFPHATLGRRVYDYILTPVINAYGEVEAVAGTTRDISDIKEEEQRKNDFISMVSHELKTPLTSVISYVQVLQRRADQNSDKTAVDMLERAGKQLSKMTRMINGFLNVSRLESGRIQIDNTLFNLSTLIAEVQEETASTVFGHTVVFEPAPDIQVSADREKIGQVFNNLISNAVKYSPSGSSIYVSCKKVDGFAQISIKDEGVGISKDDLPRLFERYYRVKEAEANHIAGFGIGLYLCSEIIKLHGGRIWAESEPDKGSIFYFTLPVA